MNLSPLLRQRFFDSNGVPLAGGLLYSYQGGTSTPQATYSNQSGTTNTNPVVLDSQGYADVWIDPALSYKFVLKDSASNTLWTVDNVSSPTFTLAWSASTTYSQGQIVQDSSGQGVLYVSLQNSNTGNALSNPSYWRIIAGNVRTLIANTTLAVTDNLVRSNSTSGSLTHTLPPCSSSPIGLRITVKDVGTGGNTTSVKGSGADLIDGNNVWANTLSQNNTQTFFNNGTSWDATTNQPVSVANIANGSITQPLLASRSTGSSVPVGGVAISASCNNFSTSSTTPVAVTNLSVTIITTGRPVWIGLVSDGFAAFIGVGSTTGDSAAGTLSFAKGGTIFSNYQISATATKDSVSGLASTVPASSVQCVDFPSAGTYTYSLQAAAGITNSPVVYCEFAKLVAYEL